MGKIISVITVSYNSEGFIKKFVDSLLKNLPKDSEVIILDNNSKDNTAKIAKKLNKVKVYNFGPERSAQRNYGAKKAVGKYLLFLDADMKLTPKVVEECVKKITRGKKIGGIAIPEESVAYSFWEKVKSFERSFYNENGDPITDAARFFPKEIFNKVGGYDETITGPEDWDLPESIREMGYKTERINEKIYHRERVTSLFTLFVKKFYYGLHAHKYLQKHNIALVSPKTVYFLRPLFYKSWRRLLSHPLLAIGMIVMLVTQTLGGGLGYSLGRLKRL